jgi:outer membrane protein insertion porin family
MKKILSCAAVALTIAVGMAAANCDDNKSKSDSKKSSTAAMAHKESGNGAQKAKDVVSKIVFEGLDRVEPGALMECLSIHPNKAFDQKDIDDSLKALFGKDFFSDIKFMKRNDVMVIKCVEKPMVDRVAFEGNDAASDEVLKNVVNNRIGNGRLLNMYVIRDVLSDFQGVYKVLGFCSAVVIPKIIKHPGNKVDVVFEINEGSKTTVKKILFIGNKSFDDDILKDVMATKEEKIWRFWDYESHVFREDKIDIDIDSITAFYKNSGYPFFMITSTSAEMDFDKKSHYCTFVMEEGDKYTISNVSLTSEIAKIKAADFKDVITLKKGDIYSEKEININRNKLRRKIALQDNPFIDVAINTDYDKVNKTASIRYVITEVPKAFLDRIEIIGNTKTLDHVIRREFTIHEGDALNVYKIQQTIERLKNAGYFDDVEVSEAEGSSEDRKVLVVNVKEKESTAQIHFGLNASTIDGFGGMFGFVEHNLAGTGRILSADAFWMQKYYGCKFDLFDPRFMDQNFGAGISIGASCYDRKNVDQSITKSFFVSPYVKYAISEDLYHTIRFTISRNSRRWWSKDEHKSYASVPVHAKNLVLMKDEFGDYSCGEISSTLFYSQTDNPYDPRSGYDLSMTNSYAGVFGKVKYFKNEFEAKYYHPLTEKITFIADANVGHIQEIRGTRSAHRFALGGDGVSMRGFNAGGVGTRDLRGNSVGGNKYWTISFMAEAPLSTKEIGINGLVFLDFGSSWGTKYAKSEVRDSKGIRSSAGVAIEWAKSPLGMPISFVFGFPIKKKSFDEKQTFTLSGFMQ